MKALIFYYILFELHCRQILVKGTGYDCSKVTYQVDEKNVLQQDQYEKDEKLCEEFNITLFVIPDPPKKFITVWFEPIPQNSSCYDYYQVHLVKQIDEYNDPKFETLCVADDIKSQWLLKFTNLNAGKYHVYILPCSINHFDYDNCEDPFKSADVIISEEKPQTFQRSIRSDPGAVTNNKLILLPLPAGLLVIIVAIVLYKKYKSGTMQTEISHLSENCHSSIKNTGDVFLEDFEFRCYNVEVIIFYSHDTVTKERVKLLKDYLQNCAKFKVTLLDDEIAEIIMNPSSWLMTKLNCSCSKLGDSIDSNKKIILVEPEKAFYSQQSQDICPEDEVEEEIFQHAIHTLHNDWKRSLSDYCHLFVIQFDDISMKNQFSHEFVPGVRYTIPQHLINLCINLRPCSGLQKIEFCKKLTQYLNSHEIRKINQNHTFI